uniref:DUF547 domain-containing protein n=1 Tax=Ananas comosus var. bracteatus TaxID=296719 RepID=A0A6V7NM02_ANACO|nr:unnamed protein product [Ananas comosus var. bracteatus]
MEVELRNGIKMKEMKGLKPLPKVIKSIHATPKHNRSKSDYEERKMEDNLVSSPKSNQNPKMDSGTSKGQKCEINGKMWPGTAVQNSLNQEILELEKRLQDQLLLRGSLEKALGHKPSAVNLSNDSPMPKPTKELIREIAILELEVMHLEQYLLSLYRKAFDQQASALSPTSGEISRKPMNSRSAQLEEASKSEICSKIENSAVQSSHRQKHFSERVLGPGVHRSRSSLSQRMVFSARISPSEDSLARALHSFHSQPLSFLEEGYVASSGVISLADYLGTNIADHVPETPNKLSEEMVRCMAGVYCRLADPPLVNHGPSFSPASSFSSTSAFSPQLVGDMWSPGCKRESTLDSRLINPFRVEGLKEFSGPYSTMVEIPLICRDHRRLKHVDDLLHSYKSIVRRLETVDPRELRNSEKLAFWINIHNALLMHAYLEYGIPQNNAKKTLLLMKATINVGGRSINAATIQDSILGCHTYCPGQWLRTLLYSKMKNKAGNEWQAHAIDQPEPLLRFALCSGSHSDPAVRVYTCRRLFQQLEAAKEEFIRATVGIWKEQKILLPKMIDSYSKDVKLSSQGLFDMVQRYLPETLRMAMQRCQPKRSNKIIEWVPYNLAFRYLLSRDLAFPHIN